MSDFANAAGLTRPLPGTLLSYIHGRPISEFFFPVPVPRDDDQSTAQNKIPMDHPELLKFYADIGRYNSSGASQITMVENLAGAQCQIDGLCGRDPYETIQNSTGAFELSLGVRPLIRASNGVGLEVLHPDDLEKSLRSIADAADGKKRLITMKLFEAQDRPEDLIAALKVFTKLRREGYLIEVEYASPYTADAINDLENAASGNDDPLAKTYVSRFVYDAQHYEDSVYNFFTMAADPRHGIDLAMITGFGVKDMIGMLMGGAGEVQDGNSYKTTQAYLRGYDRFIQEHPELRDDPAFVPPTFCMHNHNTGHGSAALAASIAAFLDTMQEKGAKSYMAKMKMRGDFIPDGSSFASLTDTDNDLKTRHGYDLGISDVQREVHSNWAKLFQGLKKFYDYCLIDQTILSGVQKRFAFIAGGALGSDDRMAMTPLVSSLQAGLKRQGMEIDDKTARSMVSGLFIYVRRQLYFDNGHPHSVTPSAYNLSGSTKDVIDGMIDKGFVKKMLDSGVDLAAIGNSKEMDVRLPKEWIAQFSGFYTDIRHAPSLAYFRRMPRAIHPVLAKHYADHHLQKILPTTKALAAALGKGEQELADADFASLPLGGIANAGNYAELRDHLLTSSNDKDGARAVLGNYSPDQKAIDLFVRQHIGNDEMPADFGVKPFGHIVEREAKACQDAGELKISLSGAIFAGLNMGLKMGKIEPSVASLWKKPASLFPFERLAFFFDKWGKTAEQLQQYAAATAKKVVSSAESAAAAAEALMKRLQAEVDAGTSPLFDGQPEGCCRTYRHDYHHDSKLMTADA